MMLLVSILLNVFFVQYNLALHDESELTAEEWNRFPPLRHVDRFIQCVGDKGGVYCTGNIEIVPEGANELYDKMLNFSNSASHHLNYTKAVYGYCMTRRCKQFYTGASDAALEAALGACLNHTLQQEYGLRARVEHAACYRHGDQRPLTGLDCAAAALFFTFIALSAVGTIYNLLVTNKDPKGYLMCFSLPANWSKLMAPWPQDRMTARLIGLNGIRTISSIFIIILHAMIIMDNVENMDFIEDTHKTPALQVIIQGFNMVMQTFFFLSGFLLVFQTERSNERNPKTWRSLPKAILLRWLRLAPVPYAIILFIVTWFKFTPTGPFWEIWVNREVEDCQRNWPVILFFTQNYVNGLMCSLQLWSTAVDFHMHILGLTILLVSPTKRIRNSLLWMVLIIGLVLPVIETYAKDLKGAFVVVPLFTNLENIVADKTFTHIYKRSHTNIPGFVIGMLLGSFVYNWQKNPTDVSKYKKYTILYWMLLPVLMCVSFANVFLLWSKDGRGDISTRLLVALLRNPAWNVTLAFLTVGMIYQVEKVALYRRVLEWPGWVPLARLTYCSYNLHPGAVIRWLLGSSLTLFTGSMFSINLIVTGVVVMSFVMATALWLLVEAPCTNIVIKLFPEKRSSLHANTIKTE